MIDNRGWTFREEYAGCTVRYCMSTARHWRHPSSPHCEGEPFLRQLSFFFFFLSALFIDLFWFSQTVVVLPYIHPKCLPSRRKFIALPVFPIPHINLVHYRFPPPSLPFHTPHSGGVANQLNQFHCHQARWCPGMKIFTRWEYPFVWRAEKLTSVTSSVDSLALLSAASSSAGLFSPSPAYGIRLIVPQLQACCPEARHSF